MPELRDESQFCATCGKNRGPLEARRESWGFHPSTPLVPRSEDPEQKPWQQTNDLIVGASVYRNGGTNEKCHLCDNCLRIGLRVLKAEIDRMLELVEAGNDKDAEIVRLKEELGRMQGRRYRLRGFLDSIQYHFSRRNSEAIAYVLSIVPKNDHES